jgi:hypothetical protein
VFPLGNASRILQANSRLGSEGLPVTNGLAYFVSLVGSNEENMFFNIDTECQCYKTFFFVTDAAKNKL